MTQLPGFLRGHYRCRGKKVAEIARQCGIERARLSRILSGAALPGTKNMLKIALFLGEHPAKLFDLAGQEDVAKLFRDLLPEHPLERRVARLIAEGMAEEVEQCLSIVEGAARKAQKL